MEAIGSLWGFPVESSREPLHARQGDRWNHPPGASRIGYDRLDPAKSNCLNSMVIESIGTELSVPYDKTHMTLAGVVLFRRFSAC